MSKRNFHVELSVEADILIDDAIFEMVDDEWRKDFYDLSTIEEIVNHIAYNVIVNHTSVSNLDGWASLDDDCVDVKNKYWTIDSVDEGG